MTGSWTSLLWFALVVALIPAALWLLKRSGMAGRLTRSPGIGLRQVGALAVGPQQRVVAVEVGQGDARRWLVLGVTPQQINALHVMDQWPGGDLGGDAADGREAPTGVFAREMSVRLGAGWAGGKADGTHSQFGAPARATDKGRT